MLCDFSTTTYGKWILSGEHAVLRGQGALVFPIKSHHLTLSYYPKSSDLSADFSGTSGKDMKLLFWSVLEQGQQLLGHSLNQLSGHFKLECTIPIGVGMGASAALSVATARWFAAQQFINKETISEFAQNLEHLFHGQSSGLDIAGVASECGLYFHQGQIEPLAMTAWRPTWYLSSCGQIGITAHCIEQVNQLWSEKPELASQIDKAMNNAVNKARKALQSYTPSSILHLAEAIKESAACFQRWGLVSENLFQHMQWLYGKGALAVKPTGSGKGGYVVSLWKNPPEIPTQLIEL